MCAMCVVMTTHHADLGDFDEATLLVFDRKLHGGIASASSSHTQMTCAEVCVRLHESKELRWRLLLLFAFAIGALMISMGDIASDAKWHLLFWYSAFLIITAQMSDTVEAFFLGEGETIVEAARYMLTGSAEAPSQVPRSQMSREQVSKERAQVGFWTLMPSAFITWIFAKSIYNAAVLGGRFGILGGVAYAGWYTSFWSAGLVGYWMRTRQGVRSLPSAIEKVYGPAANLCFSILLLFRLWNEVWSNILVIGNFFGPSYSAAWWTAALISATVPATYVLMGGMRASLKSDVLQAALGLVFLFVILARVNQEMGPEGSLSSNVGGGASAAGVFAWEPPNGWLPGGEWCLVAALVQGFISYPFHDPVLTDRTFLSRPRTMLLSFIVGGAVSMTFIVLFSAVGIYACAIDVDARQLTAPNSTHCSGAPTIVSAHLSGTFEAFMTLVMMTSSLSTLDSTFTSAAKLVGLEVCGWLRLPGDVRPAGVRGTLAATDPSVNTLHIAIGRIAILFLCFIGTIFLELGKETDALKATTVSGTMVMGLGPPVYLAMLWKYNSKPGADDGWRKSPLAFMGSFVPGVFFGIS